MSNENDEKGRKRKRSSSSSSSEMEATENDDLTPCVFNLFLSVPNDSSASNDIEFKITSPTKKSLSPSCGENSESHNRTTESIDEGENFSVSEGMESEESLLDALLSQQMMDTLCDIEELANTFIKLFVTSETEALRTILELFLRSAGFSQQLTNEQALQLNRLSKICDPDLNAPIMNKFYLKNITKFLKLVIVAGICLDNVLIMERIKKLLELFEVSYWVSARYTALMFSSLITIQCIELWSKLDAVLCGVSVTGNELELKVKKEMAKNLFQEFIKFVIFILKGEKNLTVRKNAYTIFLSWCQKGYLLLMTESYLWYVYYALFEKSSATVHVAIKTCWSLYKNEYVVKNVKSFVDNTLPVIARKTHDKTISVSIAAFEVLIDIQRRTPRLLSCVEMDPVFMLVYGVDRVRAAKACDLVHQIFKDISSTNMEYILNTVQFMKETIESGLHTSLTNVTQINEDYKIDSTMKIFVDNFFPTSYKKLTDWAAWRQLLLSDALDKEKKNQELACLLLLEVLNYLSIVTDDRYFIDTDFPPRPEWNGVRIPKKPLDGKENIESRSLDMLKEMTSNLGPAMPHLWHKYKTNKKCLIKLVAIPQYFNGQIDFTDIKGLCCFMVHLRNVMYDSATLSAIHRSMACVYHLLFDSEKREHFIPKFEYMLFKEVVSKFVKTCVRLTKQRRWTRADMSSLIMVKKSYYLSKYFDITRTRLQDDIIFILRLSVATKKPKLICLTMVMCLFVLQWQLKNLIEGKFDEDEKKSRLYKIKSHSRMLVIQLECLLSHENSVIRQTAYTVTCKLYTLLSPSNAFVRNFPLIHLPKPPLETKEWLHYILVSRVSMDTIPEDKMEFKISCVTLQMYCELLKVRVLNLGYMSPILSYFQFYKHPKNYNSVLVPAIRDLARMELFSLELIECLVWAKINTDEDVEENIKGLCTVALPAIQPKEFARKTAHKIILNALKLITDHSHYFILPMLVPFAKFLDKRVSENLFIDVVDRFRLHMTEEVREFLDALEY